MQVAIPETWRGRLREVRQRQLPDWHHYMQPVEAAMGTEVVLLQYGLGTASFLGLDGRGYGWNAAEDQPPQQIDHGPTVSGLLVWASRVQPGMPDLAELLPPPDANGVTCPVCEGRRWFAKREEEWPGGWVCMACRGMGWIDKARTPARSSRPGTQDAEPAAAADGGGM